MKANAATDAHTGPIRTYAEVVAAMRARGDNGITTSTVWWYEQSAFRKLRKALSDIYDDYAEPATRQPDEPHTRDYPDFPTVSTRSRSDLR